MTRKSLLAGSVAALALAVSACGEKAETPETPAATEATASETGAAGECRQ